VSEFTGGGAEESSPPFSSGKIMLESLVILYPSGYL